MRALSNNVSCVATGVVLAMLSGLADAGATTEGTLKFRGKLEAPPDRGCEIIALTYGEINFVEDLTKAPPNFIQEKHRRATFRINTGGKRRDIRIGEAKFISAPEGVTQAAKEGINAGWVVRSDNMQEFSFKSTKQVEEHVTFNTLSSDPTGKEGKVLETVTGEVELHIERSDDFTPGEYEAQLMLTCE